MTVAREYRGERLTYEEAQAGAPCRGCGAAMDGRNVPTGGDIALRVGVLVERGAIDPAETELQGQSKKPHPLIYPRIVEELVAHGLARFRADGKLEVTDAGRAAYDWAVQDERRFLEQHANCHAGRWHWGAGPAHCNACCAPPPLSPSQIANIAGILHRGRHDSP